MEEKRTCINCGHILVQHKGIWLCNNCNEDRQVFDQPFFEEADGDEYIFIECPGASIYDPETREVVEGVEFVDDEDPSKGYRIIGHPIFAPTHTRRRKIKKDALGNIRRCQACQDYTVRLMRKEGRDFFIPSNKYPGRKKLKAVNHRNFA